MNTAYIFGCSHSMGSEIEAPGIGSCTPYNLENSFTSQLARMLGYTPVNKGFPGGSNDYIYRMIHEVNATPNDLIIAVWTGTERIEIYDEILEEWLQFSKGMDLSASKYTKTHQAFYDLFARLMADKLGIRGQLNKVKNIIAGNTLAKLKNIPIVNLDAFMPMNFPGKESLNWLFPETSYWEWAERNNYSHTSWYHYRLDAHTDFAKLAYKEILDKNLLK